jgi:YggT family protein
VFIVSNLIQAAAGVLGFLIEILWWLIVIRAVLSWVNPDPYNPIVQFIERSTEPVLAPFRNIVPSYRLGLDLSPLFALLLLYFLKVFLVQSLLGIAIRLNQ